MKRFFCPVVQRYFNKFHITKTGNFAIFIKLLAGGWKFGYNADEQNRCCYL